MAKYNTSRKLTSVPDSVNAAGGKAYTLDPKQELAELLLSSNIAKMAYKNEDEVVKTLETLVGKVDPLFAAKAAVYTRHVEGKRTSSQLVASFLASKAAGQLWAKDFYEAIVKRPDDMLEIVAHYFRDGRKPIPNAMKKGFANAFGKFTAYHLAKYKKTGSAISLKDLTCLVHPTPKAKNGEALKMLVEGTLRSTQTWEAKLSEAGQLEEGEDESVKEEKKAEVWKEMVSEKSLGYLALLRNLRNMLLGNLEVETVNNICTQLTDKAEIKKSLVYPTQIYIACTQIFEMANSMIGSASIRKVLAALDEALEISVDNVPDMEGSVVLVDQSGSMKQPLSDGGTASVHDVAHVFAAALMKKSNVDVICFSDRAYLFKYSPKSSIMDLVSQLNSGFLNGGTSLHAAFEMIKATRYKRMIILSDMQVWSGASGGELFKGLGYAPYLYSVNLQSHGSATFDPKNRKVAMVAGWSSEVFNLMKNFEIDPKVLINTIEAIDFKKYKAH